MNFIIEWIIFTGAIMLAMMHDNLWWVVTSPEYKYYKLLPLIKPKKG